MSSSKLIIPSAIEQALHNFRSTLSDNEMREFEHVSNEKDLRHLIEKMETDQGSRNCLQNMARIDPFITGIAQYSRVIEVFAQVKPEILCLIWVSFYPWNYPIRIPELIFY
jgi:hypothetical protein